MRDGYRLRWRLTAWIFAAGFACGLAYLVMRDVVLRPAGSEEAELVPGKTILFARGACGGTTRYVRKAAVLGTYMTVQVHTRSRTLAGEATAAAVEEVGRLEKMMSRFDPESDLSRVNRRAGVAPVKAPDELLGVVERSLTWCRRTSGALDITCVPLLEAYKKAAAAGRAPDDEEISAALKRVDWRKVHVDRAASTIRFDGAGMSLDLGATAKGYAVEEAARVLKKYGIKHALVEIGGEVVVFGGRGDGKPWRVGIRDPRRRGRYLATVALVDGAVATSGNYERYIEAEGRRHSHIVDPRTGRTADAAVSVTVVASDCLDADALATAFSVMGPEKALDAAKRLDGVETLFLWREGGVERVMESEGFGRLKTR